MSERVATSRNETREQEAQPLSEKAIEAALTGFAKDGGAWMQGREVFNRMANEGHSLNASLDASLETVAGKGDPESTPTEAKLRFWDNMDPNREEGKDPTPAIERALTGFAADGGTWLKARDTFYHDLSQGATIEEALDAASFVVEVSKPETETHPEIAKDRFYGGVDPDYADRDHFGGREKGIRISQGSARIEIGFGRSVEEKRQRRLGRLAAAHRRRTQPTTTER